MTAQISLLYVTYPDVEAARAVSSLLLEKRLVACANIFSAHEAMYLWDGAVQKEQEIAVLYKYKADHFDVLEALIVKEHPYETPCIVSLSIDRGHPPFLHWVEEVSSKSPV